MGTTNLFDKRWHHVAVVLDTDERIEKAILYVDGTADPISDYKEGEVNTSSDSNVLIGGSDIVTDGYRYKDDVRIYDRALSAEEIAVLAAMGL
ncbi:MAG: LamG domain-containing protein [Planctomycetes bacterium]|nr:LamG domain-containing protein [Planctomycetota bacterium]